MKILIDNHLLEKELRPAPTFPEFCEQIMNLLLPRNLSIGSCEFDGKVVYDAEEANELFARSQICHIASIPLAVAMETALTIKCMEAQKLESDCEELVTQALLAEPKEIVALWQALCEEIKSQVGFLPRLSGLLTKEQVDLLTDRHLKELSEAMNALQKAFNKADTVEISDILELQLLPWLRQLHAFMETCLQLAKKLAR